LALSANERQTVFVITADQVGSRRDSDRTGALMAEIAHAHAEALLLPPDQTAGDEIQLVTPSAATALAIVLDTTRTGRWSVGLGVGDIRMPLPDAARKATGPAFIAAREAVDAAKRADGRFALRAVDVGPAEFTADEVEALIRLLVLLRERRSDLGWEVVDLMNAGHLQKEVAGLLDVSAAAVSARLKAAMWRAERDARPALVRLLEHLDTAATDDVGADRYTARSRRGPDAGREGAS
jgi:hypothetical protein